MLYCLKNPDLCGGQMETNIQTIRNEIRKLPLENGCNQTGIPCVTVYRFTEEKIPMPLVENPYLYIVLDGMLRLHTPSGIMDYMAGQYSISRIDTPFMGTVLNFSEQQDFLALESVSQFIRNYRKMFGSAPKEDILNIRKHLKK